MDVTLKRLDEKETLSYYRRHILEGYAKKTDKAYILPEACVAGLVAKKLYKGYVLTSGRKLIGLCFLVSNKEDSVFLLHYFYIIKKYRGYNYSEILFELLGILIQYENKERTSPAAGIFFEVKKEGREEGEGLSKKEKELRFYKGLGAYMTDLLPDFKEKYHVLFLPFFRPYSRAELKELILGIYGGILPSFKDNKKFIKRYTE